MKLKSIKFMATATIIIGTLVTITIFGFFSYKNTKTSLEKKYFKESDLVMEYTLLGFKNLFNHASRLIGELAQDRGFSDEVYGVESTRLNMLFRMVQQALPDSRSIKLGLENGSWFQGPAVDMPTGYDPRNLNWYKMAKQQEDQVVWSEPYLDYLDQIITVTAAQTVKKSNGDVSGVIAVDYELSVISRSISYSRIGEQGYVMMLNPSGTVIANKGNYWIGERVLGEDLAYILKNAQQKHMKYELKGKHYYLKLSQIKESSMLVVTAISEQEMDSNLWAAQFPVLITGVFCLLVFGTASYILAIRGIVPLERFIALMKSAEQGNYEVHMNMNDYDEIQSLAKGFNTMIASIKKRDEALQASNQQVYQLAYFDSLTGLLNRRHLIETIDKAIREESGTPMALIYMDLDNFKTINDTLGHLSGDKLLIEIANRLQVIPIHCKDVARIGGDEFVMVLHGVNLESRSYVEEVMNQICIAFREPLQIGDHSYQVTASLGVAFYPDHGVHLDELLKRADTAMYQSKASGKNGFSIFADNMPRRL